MGWLVSNWRLKLLALALAVALLTAVAFSENPVTLATVQAKIRWTGQRDGIVLVQPPAKLPVTLVGLAAAIKSVGDQSITIRADVSKVDRAGTFTVPLSTSVLVSGVTVQTAQNSLLVNADVLSSKELPVDVQVNHLAPGLALTSKSAQCGNGPCKITVTGPGKIVNANLTASVIIQDPVTVSTTFPGEPITLTANGKPYDLIKADAGDVPLPTMTSTTATAIVAVARGNGSRPVALRPTVTGRPACGYAITQLNISPGNGIANVSGSLDAIQNVADSLPIGNVDVSGATGNVVSNQAVQAPTGVTPDPAQVTVTVVISRQFDCTAPTPTPTPVPSPSPSR